jgi:transcriptional adapter 2-alpha
VCGKNLLLDARIRCVECSEKLDFCVSCVGKEIGGHSRTHSFQILSGLGFVVFALGWTAEEELLLLEALTLYGFGNWSDVGDHVGTKTEEECFEHYQRIYAGPTFPQPLDPKIKVFFWFYVCFCGLIVFFAVSGASVGVEED